MVSSPAVHLAPDQLLSDLPRFTDPSDIVYTVQVKKLEYKILLFIIHTVENVTNYVL